jgi:hypothetical protein
VKIDSATATNWGEEDKMGVSIHRRFECRNYLFTPPKNVWLSFFLFLFLIIREILTSNPAKINCPIRHTNKSTRKIFILSILTVFLLIVLHPYNASGYIAFNTVRNINESPYVVTGDIHVPQGITLKIDPGVIVKCDAGRLIELYATLVVNGTFEFNQIVFNSEKQILFIGATGVRYSREEVMRRTIAHEIGHALLAASEADHCTDYRCIMYHSVIDWEMRDFGAGDCFHKPGGSKDIWASGVVHNSIH